ncbi:hypothetical protein OS493_032614 [Desmophyllum pertusum]|uniref:Uncharacterized protein n=1 Tax=Desmophyllum pertusum TaxID=174260 RepID=A0A9W9YMK8_9CNID|nr:hypothetical protein OS493_032614 [Desmophyllum pertusum]
MAARSFPDHGKAVPIPGESSPKDNNYPLCDYEESSIGSLIQKSMQVTEGLKNLQRENNDPRVKVQERKHKHDDPNSDDLTSHRVQYNADTSHGSQQGYAADNTKLRELLTEKQKEVDKYIERLAAMSEKKFIQDQRATENTLSANRQSDLENQYIVEFKDGKRVDATDIILKKLLKGLKTGPPGPRPTVEQLKSSRLACLIFEVSYECAATVRTNFMDVSETLLDNLVMKAPSIAFLDVKKPASSELFHRRSSSNRTSTAVQDALKEVMVLVKETAVNHKLDKLVQTVRKDLETKWRQQCQRNKEHFLPPYDGPLTANLTKYIEYCCQFSWRMVTKYHH